MLSLSVTIGLTCYRCAEPTNPAKCLGEVPAGSGVLGKVLRSVLRKVLARVLGKCSSSFLLC